MKNKLQSFWHIWQFSLLSFVVAGVAGFLNRYGMLAPLPDFLAMHHIRHAHTHLMFFNWVTIPLMTWIAAHLIWQAGLDSTVTRSFKRILWVGLLLGGLTFPLFLLYGYAPVAIGSSNLPLAAIISGVVMLFWYVFVWKYWIIRRKLDLPECFSFYDAALMALVISSIGAWGVSVIQYSGMDDALLASALTRFFLAVFSEGWTILAILGLIWSRVDGARTGFKIPHWLLWQPILMGSMLLFPLSLSEDVVTQTLLWSARVGIVLVAGGLLLNIIALWSNVRNTATQPSKVKNYGATSPHARNSDDLSSNEHNKGVLSSKVQSGGTIGPDMNNSGSLSPTISISGAFLRIVLFFMFIKLLMQLIVLFPLDIWPGNHGVRVLYLHVIMLGLYSIVAVDAFLPASWRIGKHVFYVSSILVILSLVLVSGHWPHQFTPSNVFLWLMKISMLPVFAALYLWVRGIRYKWTDDDIHDSDVE
jgi:hypothetical protein